MTANEEALFGPHTKFHKLERSASTDRPNAVAQFEKKDRVIDEVYYMIAKAVPKKEVYDYIKQTMNYSPTNSLGVRDIYKMAMKRFADNTDLKHEEMRNIFYTRYEMLLHECLKKGDLFNARCTMDSMCRIFGIEKGPTIEIKKDKIKISFGFNSEEGEENKEEEVEDAETVDEGDSV